jgi:non-specific serine/threonine protein kinase
MAEAKDTASFGALLRRHRLARGLPQEALAERAGLGTRSIQDLERGINQPRRETLQRLIEALALPREEEAQLEAAAQPRPRRRKGALVTAPTAAGGSPWPGEATPRSPLPVPLTSFVGRERELAEIKELLQTTRLVTLTGAGGCGKTRLALQIAADRAGAGVALVELAALVDPTRVPPTIAERLGVREMPPTPLATTLVAALREKNLFLVLDNCEHLVEACADIVDTLLRGCSGLQVLATSREPLGIVGEVCWRVPSLAAPNPAGHLPAGAAERFDAIRLFVARARATRPGFAFSDANALSVARICWQLDGIPLAIELAAARLNLFTPSQIAERLGDRFRLLTGGGRTAPARQRTLRAAIDWSYELLTDAARALFRRLAVFGGGFDLDAAEVVCSDEAGLISRGDVLPHLV